MKGRPWNGALKVTFIQLQLGEICHGANGGWDNWDHRILETFMSMTSLEANKKKTMDRNYKSVSEYTKKTWNDR